VVVVHIKSTATHKTAGQSPLAWGFAGLDPAQLPAVRAAWAEGLVNNRASSSPSRQLTRELPRHAVLEHAAQAQALMHRSLREAGGRRDLAQPEWASEFRSNALPLWQSRSVADIFDPKVPIHVYQLDCKPAQSVLEYQHRQDCDHGTRNHRNR